MQAPLPGSKYVAQGPIAATQCNKTHVYPHPSLRGRRVAPLWCKSVPWASWYSAELSYVNDVSVLAAAASLDSDETFPAVDAADCHAKIKDLKDLVHTSRKRKPCPHYGIVEVYPASWQEFRCTYPTIFASAYPSFKLEDPATAIHGPQTPCPLDDFVLDQIRMQIPARNTHRTFNIGLRGARRPQSARNGNADANSSMQQMQLCFQSMMAACMRGEQPRASIHEEPGLPGFRMLQGAFPRGAFNLLSNYSVVVVLSADVFVSYSETSITA